MRRAPRSGRGGSVVQVHSPRPTTRTCGTSALGVHLPHTQNQVSSILTSRTTRLHGVVPLLRLIPGSCRFDSCRSHRIESIPRRSPLSRLRIHGQVAEQQTRCGQNAVSIVTWRCNSSPGYQLRHRSAAGLHRAAREADSNRAVAGVPARLEIFAELAFWESTSATSWLRWVRFPRSAPK